MKALYSIREIKERTAVEIAEQYDISLNYAQKIKSLTANGLYSVLVDKDLTIKEKARRTNQTEAAIGSYMKALRVMGLGEPLQKSDIYPKRDLIFDVVEQEPSTFKEILDKLKPDVPDISMPMVRRHSYSMLHDRELGKVNLKLNLSSHSPFSEHELIGDLAKLLVLYVPNEEGEYKLGNKIKGKLPPREKITPGMMRCISQIFKPPKTPPVSFNIIKDYTHGY